MCSTPISVKVFEACHGFLKFAAIKMKLGLCFSVYVTNTHLKIITAIMLYPISAWLPFVSKSKHSITKGLS